MITHTQPETLIKRYEIELKNKINLKMIPNKTEEQILLQNFKYYDLEGTGFCNLRNFIKTHERIGVVLSKIKDIEEVFNHFDINHTGIINYKKFCHEIFSTNQNVETNQQEGNYIKILNEKLIANGGALALVQLLKEIHIIDYNNSRKISIDDFVKISSECKLGQNQNDYQALFQSYDIFSNGVVLYGEIFRQLLNKYWSATRWKMASDLYNSIKGYTFNDIKRIYSQTQNEKIVIDSFTKFVECYKFISKTYGVEGQIKLNEFVDFVKYYGYGIESDEELYNKLSEIIGQTQKISQQQQQKECTQSFKSNKLKSDGNSVLSQLGKSIRQLSRRALFNFIKHFRYYENESSCVTKYDFVKILKDYRINFPLLEIEKLFKEIAVDPKKTMINYKSLFQQLIDNSMTQERKDTINKIYEFLYNISLEYHDDFTVDYIKRNYIAKNNILNNDETSNKTEFNEIIELFHFCYKGIKNPLFTQEEFFELYSFMSILVENDEDFITMIENEYIPASKQKSQCKNQQQKEKQEDYIDNHQLLRKNLNPQQSPENEIKSKYALRQSKDTKKENNQGTPLEMLESILKKRGVRGLLYLHRQFIFSCPDVGKISCDDFIRVLQLQSIRLNIKDITSIYNMFQSNGFLDFYGFIRNFKKELNDNKVACVETAFSVLDVNQNEKVDIDQLKMIYNPNNHPDVLSGKISDEEKLLEFHDCFEANFGLLANEGNDQGSYVNFEIFANFYEYVAFIHEDDKEFEKIVYSTWNC